MKLLWICLMLLVGMSVQAGEIVAVVNDMPISDFDVLTRAKMIQLQQMGQVQTIPPELKKMALEDLIDDQIKTQEMVKRNISVSDEEVQNAVIQMEQQNGLPVGGLKKLFEKQKIPYASLLKQAKTNLGWMKLLQSTDKGVVIQDREIESRKNMIRQELKQTLITFAEIVVKTQEEAQKVLQQMTDGAKFETLVALHSISKTRLGAGRVIGVKTDYYGKKVAPILESLRVGDVSKPIPVANGYAIVLLLSRRNPILSDEIEIWDLAQAILPDNAGAIQTLETSVHDCNSFEMAVKGEAVAGSLERGMVNPDQLPAHVFERLKGEPFKTVIGPEKVPVGNLYFMKCRQEKQRVVPSDEELKMHIGMEKMELLSKQLLSELKRDVVIDYK